MLSKNGSIRFHRRLTPIQKPLPSPHFNFSFFLHDSKNKFVLWGRDDGFDRFLEQKTKEELAILVGGIPANSIRLYTMGRVECVGAPLRGTFLFHPERPCFFHPPLARGEWCASREFTPFRRREQLELQKVLLGLGNGRCSSCVQSFLSPGYGNTGPAGGRYIPGVGVRHRD